QIAMALAEEQAGQGRRENAHLFLFYEGSQMGQRLLNAEADQRGELLKQFPLDADLESARSRVSAGLDKVTEDLRNNETRVRVLDQALRQFAYKVNSGASVSLPEIIVALTQYAEKEDLTTNVIPGLQTRSSELDVQLTRLSVDPETLRSLTARLPTEQHKIYGVVTSPNGDTYTFEWSESTAVQFMNLWFGEARTKEVWAGLKLFGKTPFEGREANNGFSGAVVGVTLPPSWVDTAVVLPKAVAGVVHQARQFQSTRDSLSGRFAPMREAYLEHAEGAVVWGNEENVILASYRGTVLPARNETTYDASSGKPGEITYDPTGLATRHKPGSQFVELTWKNLKAGEGDASLELRGLVGVTPEVAFEGTPGSRGTFFTNPTAAVGLLSEDPFHIVNGTWSGYGVTAGHTVRDLGQFYRTINAEAENLAESVTQNYIRVHGWERSRATKEGLFVAASYMRAAIKEWVSAESAGVTLSPPAGPGNRFLKPEDWRDYGMLMAMAWIGKHQLLAGTAHRPGYSQNMQSIFDESNRQIQYDPANQETYMKQAVDRVRGLLQYPLDEYVLGWNADGTVQFLASAQLQSQAANGSLAGIWKMDFLSEQTFLRVMGNLYQYRSQGQTPERERFVDATVTFGTDLLQRALGSDIVSRVETNFSQGGATPTELQSFLQLDPLTNIGMVLDGSKMSEGNWRVEFADSIKRNSGANKIQKYTTLYAMPVGSGSNHILTIGTEVDYKKWVKDKKEVRVLQFEEDSAGKTSMVSRDPNAPVTAPIGRVAVTAGLTSKVQNLDSDQDFALRGWSAEALVEFLKTNKRALFGELTYGTKKLTDREIEQLEIVFAGTFKGESLKDSDTNFYVMFDWEQHKAIFSTNPDELKTQYVRRSIEGALDVLNVHLTNERHIATVGVRIGSVSRRNITELDAELKTAPFAGISLRWQDVKQDGTGYQFSVDLGGHGAGGSPFDYISPSTNPAFTPVGQQGIDTPNAKASDKTGLFAHAVFRVIF
ncbi:hypothetical protein HZC07_05130, partial [Candidatus Micrarchaeota archaeon]|nr:hypothetical protein [Candidatus Micrarchaeota archaeon]